MWWLAVGCTSGSLTVVGTSSPSSSSSSSLGADQVPVDTGPAQSGVAPIGAGNVLIVIADDLGVDQVGAYGHPLAPPTPNVDALAARGRRFDTAWASSTCSPTRASVMTGRLGRRTGMGAVVQPWTDVALPLAETTLAELVALAEPPWATAAVGKWHLADPDTSTGIDDPLAQGFGSYAGALGNLYDDWRITGPRSGYYRWLEVRDGATTIQTRYATTVAADDAIAAIRDLPPPWLVYLAFNAPHEPLDPPPAALCPTLGAVSPLAPKAVRYAALIEAMDTELGRVLAAIDPDDTTVVFLGDNGTPEFGVLPPLVPSQAKGTPFEGGVHVPLIVAGPTVGAPGAATSALVHAVDLFPTVAALAGVPLSAIDVPLDGLDLGPLLADPDAQWPRTALFTEQFAPNGPGPYASDVRASRDASFKVIELATVGVSVVYDVRDGVDDGLPVDVDALPPADRAEVDALLAAHALEWDVTLR
ncbi:MAG: sulfatase-like hydrolase/transferase [Myxococcota bacterium]